MKISQLKYRRCGWTNTLKDYTNDPMCMIIENLEELTAVTLKRIEWNNQY